MPVRIAVTQGTTADCKQAAFLIDGLAAEMLMADKAYDTHAILEQCAKQGIIPVIPPKRNRKDQRA